MKDYNSKKKNINKKSKKLLQSLIIKENNKKSSMNKREDSSKKLNHNSKSRFLKFKKIELLLMRNQPMLNLRKMKSDKSTNPKYNT